MKAALLLIAAFFLVSRPTVAAQTIEVTVPLQVFADVGYFARSSGTTTSTSNTAPAATPERGRDGAFVGTLTLFATPQLGDRVRSLFESVVEYNAAGKAELVIERAQIGYVFGDLATVWMGRFHTPYGYWNTAYHHGAQLQPSLTRPVLLSGSLPAHTVGAWMTGWQRMGSGRVTYDVYAGNASRVAGGSMDPNHAAEDNQDKNLGFNLSYGNPDTLEGLRIGLHGLTGKFGECATDAVSQTPCSVGSLTKTRVNMAGGYAHFDRNGFEMIAELYYFENKDEGSAVSHDSSAGFVQAGYAVLPDVIPYVRFEQTNYDQTDTYFSTLSRGKRYQQGVLGARYNLNTHASLKIEANQTRVDNLAGIGASEEIRFQYSIRF